MHVMKVVLIPRPKKAGPTLAAPKLHAKSVLGYGLFKSRARLNIYVSSKLPKIVRENIVGRLIRQHVPISSSPESVSKCATNGEI